MLNIDEATKELLALAADIILEEEESHNDENDDDDKDDKCNIVFLLKYPQHCDRDPGHGPHQCVAGN
jgi:hypothetical protein